MISTNLLLMICICVGGCFLIAVGVFIYLHADTYKKICLLNKKLYEVETNLKNTDTKYFWKIKELEQGGGKQL